MGNILAIIASIVIICAAIGINIMLGFGLEKFLNYRDKKKQKQEIIDMILQKWYEENK